MDGNEAVGLLLELFTWIGLGLAALLFLVLTIVRAVDGTWIETGAILLPDEDGVEARWMSDEGAHARRLDPHERADTHGADSVTVYYSWRSPDRMRLHRLSVTERILRLLFIIMGALGVAAFLGQLVMLFLSG